MQALVDQLRTYASTTSAHNPPTTAKVNHRGAPIAEANRPTTTNAASTATPAMTAAAVRGVRLGSLELGPTGSDMVPSVPAPGPERSPRNFDSRVNPDGELRI